MSKPRTRRIVFSAALCAVGFGSYASAADNTFSWVGPSVVGGNASWTVGANWLGGVAPVPATADNNTLIFGGTLNSGTSAQNGTTSATDTNWNVYGLVFNDYSAGAATFVINTSGTASRVLNLGAGGITDTALGSVSLNGTNGSDTHLVLTANQTWNVATAGTNNLIIRRRIIGDFTITKTGLGSLQFSAPAGMSDFNGTLDLKQGGLRLDTVGTQFASPAAHLVMNSDDDVVISATNTGLDQTIAGAVFIGGAGSIAMSGSSNFFFTGPVTLLGSDKRMQQSGTRSSNFDGPVSGAGGIIKTGSGSIVFTGSNSYAGNTAVTNGWLSVATFGQLGTSVAPIMLGSNAPGTGTTTINSGTLLIRTANQSTSRAITLDNGGGNLDFAGDLNIDNTITGTGPLTKAGAGNLTAQAIRVATLTTATGTTKIAAGGGTVGTSSATSLVLGGGTGAWTSALDITDHALIVNYPDGGPSPLATIADQVNSGRAGGAWNGNGINSSFVAANSGTTSIGYAEASQAVGASGGTFAGQDVDGSAVLVRTTRLGDSNLDGKVDLTDFTFLAGNFNKASGAQWIEGDYNYDGKVDLTDFTFLASNFNQTFPSSGGDPGAAAVGNVVPEPATLLSALAVTGACTLRRRRRSSRS